MTVATSIAIRNGDGQAIECSAVVEAMILVLLHADDAICEHKLGFVELHYVRGSAKVSGKLRPDIHLGNIRKGIGPKDWP